MALGTKRLPQEGEVWATASGGSAYVCGIATKIDGGLKVLMLHPGQTVYKTGDQYVVDFDGRFISMGDGYNHPLDLIRLVTDLT